MKLVGYDDDAGRVSSRVKCGKENQDSDQMSCTDLTTTQVMRMTMVAVVVIMMRLQKKRLSLP